MKTQLGRNYTQNWKTGQNYAHCRITRFNGKTWTTRLYKHISRASFYRLNMVDIARLEGEGRRVVLTVH